VERLDVVVVVFVVDAAASRRRRRRSTPRLRGAGCDRCCCGCSRPEAGLLRGVEARGDGIGRRRVGVEVAGPTEALAVEVP